MIKFALSDATVNSFCSVFLRVTKKYIQCLLLKDPAWLANHVPSPSISFTADLRNHVVVLVLIFSM